MAAESTCEVISSLKMIPNGRIDIGIVLELAEKGMRRLADKNIRTGFESQIVGGFVVEIGTQIGVVVAGRVLGKQRKLKVLVHQQARQPQRRYMPVAIAHF